MNVFLHCTLKFKYTYWLSKFVIVENFKLQLNQTDHNYMLNFLQLTKYIVIRKTGF